MGISTCNSTNKFTLTAALGGGHTLAAHTLNRAAGRSCRNFHLGATLKRGHNDGTAQDGIL